MKTVTVFLSILFISTCAHAGVTLDPTCYEMNNGDTGTYNYWDDSYSGTGNKTLDGAPLSGGLGDLTDGVVANKHWRDAESPAGAGPYVGWKNIDPTITFNFAAEHSFECVYIHLDDANGDGNVYLPQSAYINNSLYTIPSGANEPRWVKFDVSGQALKTDALTVKLVQLQRNDNNRWVFASEFKFTGEAGSEGTSECTTVPAPGAVLLAGLGAGLVGYLRRRSSI